MPWFNALVADETGENGKERGAYCSLSYQFPIVSNLMVTLKADAQQWDSPCPQIRLISLNSKSSVPCSAFEVSQLQGYANSQSRWLQLKCMHVTKQNMKWNIWTPALSGKCLCLNFIFWNVIDNSVSYIRQVRLGILLGDYGKRNEAGKLLSYQRLLIVTGMSK